jgi:hypothetical protein
MDLTDGVNTSKKNISVAATGMKPQFIQHPACSPVTIPDILCVCEMSKKIGQIALSAKVSTDPLTLLHTALEGHFNIIL